MNKKKPDKPTKHETDHESLTGAGSFDTAPPRKMTEEDSIERRSASYSDPPPRKALRPDSEAEAPEDG